MQVQQDEEDKEEDKDGDEDEDDEEEDDDDDEDDDDSSDDEDSSSDAAPVVGRKRPPAQRPESGDLLDDDFEGGPLESEGESDSDAELVAPAGLPGAAPAQPTGKQQQRKKKKQKRSVVRF